MNVKASEQNDFKMTGISPLRRAMAVLFRLKDGKIPAVKEQDNQRALSVLPPDLAKAPPDVEGCCKDDLNSILPDHDQLIDRLRANAQGLTDICKQTEPNFLDLGAQLNQVHSQARELTHMATAFVSADQGHAVQDTLKDIQLYTADANRELKKRCDNLHKDMRGLKLIADDLFSLNHHNRNFKQMAKNLKMVGLNVSIESARSQESRDHFHSLALEIVALSQTVNAVAGEIKDNTDNANYNIEHTQSIVGEKIQHLDALLESAEMAASQALEDVQGLMQMTMTALDHVSTKAAEIANQMGRLVVGVQIHDNITQRVAHIDAALQEALVLIQTGLQTDMGEKGLMPVYGKTYGMLRLQITQLNIIGEDVATIQAQCTHALDQLQEAIKAVAKPNGFSVSENKDPIQADTNDFTHSAVKLKQALNQLVSLFDEGLSDIQLLSQVRKETGKTINRMNGYMDKVKDINFQIHLKALNAVIKSTRLGRSGRSIEVLVTEMKALAEYSNQTITSTTEVMQRITSASDQMDEKDQQHTKGIQEAEQCLSLGVEKYSDNCQRLNTEMNSAAAIGAAIERQVQAIKTGLGFFDRLITAFRRHGDDLQRISLMMAPFASIASEDWKAEEEIILKRYTMDRERQAHKRELNPYEPLAAQLTPFPEGGGSHPGKSEQAQGAAIEFDDNVELF